MASMLRNFTSCFSAFFCFAVSILLTSCVNTPVVEEDPEAQEAIATEEVETSDTLVDQQLSAIEALIQEYQFTEAELILDTLNFETLLISDKTRYVLAKAEIALLQGLGRETLYWLSGDYAHLLDGLPLDEQVTISLKRAQAYEFTGQPLAAARERVFVSPLLTEDEAASNNNQIWFNLQLVPPEQITEMVTAESSPDLTGWLELAMINQTYSEDIYRLLAEIQRWQQGNRLHPASSDLPDSLQMLTTLALEQPTQIGVLLPLSGSLEKAGVAVRDGLLTAWQQNRRQGFQTPELVFYDTATSEDTYTLYQQAVAEGAQTIIGPLSKSRVQQLAERQNLAVPVLTLNYSDNGEITPNIFQFGLAPEDEAEQVADDIWQRGIRNVMVVAPDSQWGVRVSDAFIRRWQLKGGSITSKALFTQPDQYLRTIQSALNINTSNQRHAILEQTLSEELAFEFRRRQDVDMVFLLAFPAQARQLKPILDYQRAEAVPVVATSTIYSGRPDPDRDMDIEGVELVEMPWRLESNAIKTIAATTFPESYGSYATLVALGVDSYRLYPRLSQMALYDEVRIQGVTGNMHMNESGQIVRELEWAKIENGQIVKQPDPLQLDELIE